jgi:carbon-monoxide dehydrogenase medium subunit
MFPASFQYLSAHSVDEALAALAEHGSDARVLAGGQSLIPAMRYRLARPALLVDINSIADLAYLDDADGTLRIGALVRDATIDRSSKLAAGYPLIADVSAVVADPVVRQMGTAVGSLCHNDPAGDWSVAALAARATVEIRSAKGNRVVSIDDFLVDSFTTAVGDGEMAIEARFTKPVLAGAGAFKKLERKVGDFATASAAVQLTLAADGTIAEAGVAIGAVGAKALRVTEAERLLRGARPSNELARAAGDEARKLADPNADTRGDVEFKRAMAGVLVHRALLTTFERLQVGELR